MTTKELIQQYVTAHADNRWMDASELEALLTEFAEEIKESIIKMLDAEKENTGIGLCEYDAGHENGRMELIDTLKKKLSEI